MRRTITLVIFAFSLFNAVLAQNENDASERLKKIYQQLELIVSGEGSLFEADELTADAKSTYHQIVSPTIDDLKVYNTILVSIGFANMLKGDPDELKRTVEQAMSVLESRNDIEPLTKAGMLSLWTTPLQYTGEEHLSRKLLNKMLELYAENGEDTDEYANALTSYALLSYQNGNTRLAETFCKRALDMNGRLHGYEVNQFANAIYMVMATIKERHKDYSAALDLVNKAIESLKNVGSGAEMIAADYTTLQLSLYEQLGKYDEISTSTEKTVNELISNTKSAFARLNSYQRANFIDKNKVFFTSTVPYYAATIDNPRLKEVAYNSILFIKGLLLNADVEIEKVIEQSGDKALAQLHSEISKLNNQIAQYKLREDITIFENWSRIYTMHCE